ncbi:MAG: isoprenylcysteine carboxylmethyltransferase family protein [Acidobacteria bacterium]|nr:isoprenylcysteine carboxylmethyltransferase family protein [Acidobacteriota bacterium]
MAAGPPTTLPPFAAAFAWGGALAFASSLIFFAYSYIVRFEVTGSGNPVGPIAINVILFTLFALHHSLLARTRAKAWVTQLVTPALERSVYVWTASLLFLVVCRWWQPVPGVLYRSDGPWRGIAWALQAAGVILTIRATAALDVLDLAGVRALDAARGGGVVHPRLETRGIYGFVRHPLYFAWVLMVAAAPDMTATRAVFAAVSTLYLAIAIPWEERALVTRFGDKYHAYRRRVRWRMLPFIY